MSGLTILTVLVVIYGVTNSRGFGRALAIGGATPAGAALVVGAVALPTFDAVALGTVVALFLRILGQGPRPRAQHQSLPPGGLILLLFLAWSVCVTLLAPLLFDNLSVVSVNTSVLRAGHFTSSNVAQLSYLLIGVCVVFFLARSEKTGPEIMGLLTSTAILLSFWRYLHENGGLPFPSGFFDNTPSAAFIQTAPGGAERFRGIFSEPSALGGMCVVAIAYLLVRSASLRGRRRAGALTIAGIALYLGVISTSTTFVIAGLATGLIMAGVWGLGFLARRSLLNRSVALVVGAAGLVMVWLLPTIARALSSTLGDKVASASYDERTRANTDSYHVFFNSYGFGVGLGSDRASSFVPTILAATGVIGTALLVAALVVLIRRGWQVPGYRPVVWALVALIVGKISAGPDLSDGTGILWISLGILSHAAITKVPLREEAGESAMLAQRPMQTGSIR